jgi:hypothetical protein
MFVTTHNNTANKELLQAKAALESRVSTLEAALQDEKTRSTSLDGKLAEELAARRRAEETGAVRNAEATAKLESAAKEADTLAKRLQETLALREDDATALARLRDEREQLLVKLKVKESEALSNKKAFEAALEEKRAVAESLQDAREQVRYRVLISCRIWQFCLLHLPRICLYCLVVFVPHGAAVELDEKSLNSRMRCDTLFANICFYSVRAVSLRLCVSWQHDIV